MSDLTIFAKNIKRLREEKGMTLKELAETIGVSPQAVSAYQKAGTENGKAPTLDKAIDLASALGVSIGELCGSTGATEEKTLGDIALLFAYMMEHWLSAHVISVPGKCTGGQYSFSESYPALAFSPDSEIGKFIVDYSKMRDVRNSGTIDQQLFDRWVEGTISRLSGINIQTEDLPF
ncbi:MAG: helix-turn-helix transcriptional regulator [Clostridiales bacterium]|nr:helix-turn-helix transcriptional regulator [Candidatus Cacconaster stercorequi]